MAIGGRSGGERAYALAIALEYRSGLLIAVVEVADVDRCRRRIEQVKGYARKLEAFFAYATNGLKIQDIDLDMQAATDLVSTVFDRKLETGITRSVFSTTTGDSLMNAEDLHRNMVGGVSRTHRP